MSPKRLMTVVGLMAMALLMPRGVSGQEVAALDTVRAANSHYDEGSFVEALRLYRQAYDEMGDSRLLYRIGLSYEYIGNYRRARQFLERYLQEDPDSEVRGRVEAKIARMGDLAESNQSFLVIDTDPQGAEVYLHGYLGEAEGVTPAEIPVGAGENLVTLVFSGGQRLEVPVNVGEGVREEAFFQIGTTSRPVQEVAGTEEVSVEPDESTEAIEESPEVPDAQWSEEREEVRAEEEVIPMPGAEPKQSRPIQLDYVDMGPPKLAIVGSTALIIVGNFLTVSGIVAAIGQGSSTDLAWDQFNPTANVASGLVLTGAGVYLLGRRWRERLPPMEASVSPGESFSATLMPTATIRSPQMLKVSIDF